MIFYFTGTGNSQYVAEKIERETGDKLISIGVAMRDRHYCFGLSSEETVGFVLPTYAMDVPVAVKEFIGKLQFSNYQGQYTYAVITCGRSCGISLDTLRKLLSPKDMKISGAFAVVMPDNYIPMFELPTEEESRKTLKDAEKSIKDIIPDIMHHTTVVKMTQKNPPKFVAHMAGNLMSMSTKKYHTTDACTGCGLCEKLCPMERITMKDGRPIWEGNCTKCLACLHKCPVHAIQYGKSTYKRGRYVNPNCETQFSNTY